ncbi:MAG: ABC transporter permease [Rhodospirillales bacterium]|nr:ABC transporter permease [Rhodospirillales bacterium]
MNSASAIVSLSVKSLANRRVTAGLTVFAIALSVMLLLGVEKVRTEAKASFSNTISGTDLIVGARSGGIQLLLYSVFRIGNATNNISWKSYKKITDAPYVEWAIPLSLGDSHRGFRVLGTNNDYFKYYRYGRKQNLQFVDGKEFQDIFDAVLGADVAESLGYRVDDPITVTHGLGQTGGINHKDKPFQVVGILARTGTPLDRTIHVSLQGTEAIHIDWRGGSPLPGMKVTAEEVRQLKLNPKTITAFLIGLESKLSIFKAQRQINQYRKEPLLAILPGVALQELWDLMGTAEAALGVISLLVVGTSLLVMLAMLFSSLNERRREMAILRSVGARMTHIFSMLVIEAGLLVGAGIIVGVALLYAGLFILQPVINAKFGLFLSFDIITLRDGLILLGIFVAGLLSGAIPAYHAYRQSLSDGMIIRV